MILREHFVPEKLIHNLKKILFFPPTSYSLVDGLKYLSFDHIAHTPNYIYYLSKGSARLLVDFESLEDTKFRARAYL